MGWAGIENGELLALAASRGFDALLTKDAKLPYEQNLVNLPIAVIVPRCKSNDLDDIRPLIPALLSVLPHVTPKQITHVP